MDFDLGGGAQTSSRGTLLEVENVKAHRSKKEKQETTLLWNDLRTDQLAKDGAVLAAREMAQIRASTVLQKREKRFTQPCSVQLAVTVSWTEW